MIRKLLISILCLGSLSSTSLAESPSPKQQGYTFPDEWEKHEGTMMIFPAKHSYGKRARLLQGEFRNIAKAIAKNEPVHIFCYTRDAKTCKKLLGKTKNITIHVGNFRIDWARDNAPMVVRNRAGKLATAGFQFNGWGKKYEGWQEDAATRNLIAKKMKWKVYPSELVLEGGSIEIANKTGIVTESCVLNKNRTKMKKSQVEKELKSTLGLDKIIWIKSGLMPDPITDGHVDGLLKWIKKDTILLHMPDDKSDINYAICQQAKKELLKHDLKVIELPLMDDIVHMNFYIGSGGKIAYVPICGDPEQDEPALKVIRKFYPKVVTIKATAMAKAGGGIHCYTQQIPVAK